MGVTVVRRELLGRPWALPAIAWLATFGLGLTRVGDEPYWMDEATTADFVDRSFVNMARIPWGVEGGQGPYYVALWFWRYLGGGDAALRVFSVVGAATAVAALVVVARRWYGTTAAVVAAGLLFVHPFFLRYVTELRGYSWVMCLSIVSAGALVELVQRPRTVWAVVAGAASGLMTAIHFMSAFWVLSAAVAIVAVERRSLDRERWRSLSVAALITVVVAAPFLRVLTVTSSQLDWIGPTTLRSIGSVGRDTIGGDFVGAVLAVGLVAFAVVAVQRWSAGEHRFHDAMVVAMAAGGAVVLIVVSFAKPLLVVRYFSASMPFVALAAAIGFVELGRWLGAGTTDPWRRYAPLAVVAVLLGGRFVASGPFSDASRNSDPRAAVDLVLESMGPDDKIVIDRPTQSILHYLGDRPDIDPAHLETPPDVAWPQRRPVEDILDQLDAAPVVYVFTWVSPDLSPPLRAWASDRDQTRYEFDRTFVVALDRG